MKHKQDRADPSSWAYTLADGTISPENYYDAWLLMQFCLDKKKMSYEEVLADVRTEAVLRDEMMKWYMLIVDGQENVRSCHTSQLLKEYS